MSFNFTCLCFDEVKSMNCSYSKHTSDYDFNALIHILSGVVDKFSFLFAKRVFTFGKGRSEGNKGMKTLVRMLIFQVLYVVHLFYSVQLVIMIERHGFCCSLWAVI